MVTMIDDDRDARAYKPARASKAPVYRSQASEHFRGSFPLFVNRYREGFELREHDHEFVEVVYVMSGEGYHYVGRDRERTSKGCLYVLPVGTSHILRPSDASGNNGLVVYNLCIRPAFLKELRKWLTPYAEEDEGEVPWTIFGGAPGSYLKVTDEGMRLGDTFEQLHREYEERRPGYEASLFSLLLQLAVRIHRRLHGTDRRESAGAPGRAEMEAIVEDVNRRLSEPITLERLAAEAGISRRHFIRLFRQHAGMGFTDYLQHRRVELACRLLAETDERIERIAHDAGYRDLAYFRRIFRRVMGTSPGAYRRNAYPNRT